MVDNVVYLPVLDPSRRVGQNRRPAAGSAGGIIGVVDANGDAQAAKGARARIVEAAAALMYERGVRGATVDEVLAAAGAGKGQFYYYFESKEQLVREVLQHQLAEILGVLEAAGPDTWEGMRAWLDGLVESHRRRGLGGCPLGTLASEASAESEALAEVVDEAFGRWLDRLSGALSHLRDDGALEASVDPHALAEATLASVQGAYLLSAAKRDPAVMRHGIDGAWAYLQSWATAPIPTSDS